MEQQNVKQHIEDTVNTPESTVENTQENVNFLDNILNLVKIPAIVGLIAIIISIPSLTNILETFINSKEMLSKYATLIILLIKGIMAGGLYFGINKSI